ncbi:MAG: class I SAM-dependent methyltransferase [Chitinophagaceae bacterium]|jgi:predicted O-methyltransferase YrrM
MSSIIIVFRYTLGTILKLAANILCYPFSRIARHRLAAAYDAMQFSFYGPAYVEISDLLTNNELELQLAPFKSNLHNTTSFELASIAAMVKDKKCNTIFEIGTFDGRTTRAMALNLKNENGKIYTLNLPPQTESVSLQTGEVDVQLASKVVSGERFINTPQAKQIEQVWGDSAAFDFTPYQHQMDLVFIDGAHGEDYVANDTAKALQLIKPTGGWIIWHDAPYFGVVKYLEKWVPKQNGPVYFIKGTSLAVAFIKNNKVATPVL